MSRITSQGTTIMVNDPSVARTVVGITSATKAKPCVMTLAAGTAPVVGDIIIVKNSGWLSIDDRPLKVITVAAQVITLEDTDTSRETAAIRTSVMTPPANVEKFAALNGWVEMCRSNFNLNAPAGAIIDVTTLCDDAHKIVPGLPAVGTWTAAGFYDMNDTALFVARDAYRTGASLFFDVRFRDGSGVAYAGTVNTFDLTLGVNAAVANNMGGNVDGSVTFYKTPAAGFVPFMAMAGDVPTNMVQTAPPPPAMASA